MAKSGRGVWKTTPEQLKTNILSRFMSEKALNELVEDYKDARLRSSLKKVRKPNDTDLKIYKKFQETQSITETAEAFGSEMTVTRVAGAITRVVAWNK